MPLSAHCAGKTTKDFSTGHEFILP
jgi:hypothetical protein